MFGSARTTHSPHHITLADQLIATNNRPVGFDYQRIILAVFVLLSHTINVCYGKEFTQQVWSSPFRPLLALILPMFFALSGFLVAGSLLRCRTLITFLGLRLLRILPALVVEVVLSAFILGPIFTEVSLPSYFTDIKLFQYFLNILGSIHMQLPGVFAHNPWGNNVNQQLWTLPWEFRCYALLAAMSFIGLIKPNRFFIAAVVLGQLAVVGYISAQTDLIKPQVLVNGWLLVMCFIVGVGLYLFRNRVMFSAPLFFVSLVSMLLLLAVPGGDLFAAFPAAYATVYLGLLNPPKSTLISSGDYSYGIFLYGFPIQQAVAALGDWAQVWYVNLLISLPLTIAFAVFSWWCIEKPALKLRKYLNRLEAHLSPVIPPPSAYPPSTQ